jgi:glycosyl transferase family 87
MRLTGQAIVDRLGAGRLQRWYEVAVITFLADLVLFNLYQVWIAFPAKLIESDFRIWYAVATIGRHQGWSRIYDAGLQRAAVEAVWPGSLYLPFANPPPAAWVILPFTLLPFGPALALWTALSVGLLLALSQAFARPDPWSRTVFALSALGFLPAFVMVEAAPLSPIVFAGVGCCAILMKRRRHVLAGLVLSLIAVKPTIAMLVPIAILAAGYLRVFIAWLASTAALTVASVLSVGTQGLLSFIALNLAYFRDDYHLTYSLSQLLGGEDAYFVAVVVVIVLTLVAAWLLRSGEPGLPVALGVTGTLLINHHLTPADFTILLIPIWIVMSMSPPIYLRVTACALWAVAWTSSLGLAWPVAAMELLLPLVLVAPRLRSAANGPAVKGS